MQQTSAAVVGGFWKIATGANRHGSVSASGIHGEGCENITSCRLRSRRALPAGSPSSAPKSSPPRAGVERARCDMLLGPAEAQSGTRDSSKRPKTVSPSNWCNCSPPFALVYRSKVGHPVPLGRKFSSKLLISLEIPRGTRTHVFAVRRRVSQYCRASRHPVVPIDVLST